MNESRTSSSLLAWCADLVREARASKFSDQLVAEQFVGRVEKELARRMKPSEDQGGTHRSAAYLQMIRNMLGSLERGVARGEFLAGVFKAIDDGSYSQRVLLVLEGFPAGSGRIEALSAPFIVSNNPFRQAAFRAALSAAEASPFFYSLLACEMKLEFEGSRELSDYGSDTIRYNHEFRDLISGRHWICSAPLPTRGRSDIRRSLVALYPGEGPMGEALIPPGAVQEWETLGLVPALYQLLQENMGDLRKQVDNDTLALLHGLAPSAIIHEIGTGLGLMTMALRGGIPALRRLGDRLGKDDPDVMDLARNLVEIDTLIRAARRTTEAFTNLGRRNPKTRVHLQTLIDEIEIVLAQRLSRARVKMRSDIAQEVLIETDSQLLSNVIMNVMMNAVKAIELEPRDTDTARSGHTIAIEARVTEDRVQIIIANDGPEIPVQISSRIFDKGVTSKSLGVGHCYGLFLCRQIATYLGGSIGFGPNPSILPNAPVSFLLDLPEHTKFINDE